MGGLTSIAAPVTTSVTPAASAPAEAPRRRGRPLKSATAAPVAAPAVVEEPAAEESEDAAEASPVTTSATVLPCPSVIVRRKKVVRIIYQCYSHLILLSTNLHKFYSMVIIMVRDHV